MRVNLMAAVLRQLSLIDLFRNADYPYNVEEFKSIKDKTKEYAQALREKVLNLAFYQLYEEGAKS